MTAKTYDCIVLGAGIVGVSTALHLLRTGRQTALIDRQPPGEATSFGNAGLVQSDAFVPYMMPRDLSTLFQMARNRSPQVHLHYRALPGLAPWLFAYWRNSGQHGMVTGEAALRPLVRQAVIEHESLAEAAGCKELLRPTGYIRLHRDTEELEAEEAEWQRLHDRYGTAFEIKNPDQLEAMEPHLMEEFVGGIHVLDVRSLADPVELIRAYVGLFRQRGGHLLTADAGTLSRATDGAAWRLRTVEGDLVARDMIIALGPWSADVLRRVDVKIPMAVKRGYHMHFQCDDRGRLNHALLDTQNGFVLTPMSRGIRLTTGAEVAGRDAAATPVQLDTVEAIARGYFPLGQRVDREPWVGSRPCFSDMMPAIGRVPGRAGLWINTGHQHLGLTLGPVTGHLLAQMIAGEETLADPAPYSLGRFRL